MRYKSSQSALLQHGSEGWKKFSFPLALALLILVGRQVPAAAQAHDPLGATPHFGATVSAGSVTFRVWAPFVEGVSVQVDNQTPHPMTREAGHPDPADAVWVSHVAGAKPGNRYRYLATFQGVTRRFIDPRSQQLSGSGSDTSSVVVDPRFTPQSIAPPSFSISSFNTLVIYEMHIGTFHASSVTHRFDFNGASEKLDYLKSLGVNCIEVMPVHQNASDASHAPANYNWGYDPVQLYAVNSAYGTPQDFKRFVAQCHSRGIAVILDVVYNHFAPSNLLMNFGGYAEASVPKGIYFYGDIRGDTPYGPRPDYGRTQVRSYVEDNSLMWLRDYGIDGLRWDSTVNIRSYDNQNHYPIDDGARLLRESNAAYRETPPQQPGKISIAEDLQGNSWMTKPKGQNGLGFNSQWDDDFYRALSGALVPVKDEDRDVGAVGAQIQGSPTEDVFRRVIYLENHDKVGHPDPQHPGGGEIRIPARVDFLHPESVYAKKRATLGAAIVLTAPGIPMIFQGEEMLENRSFDFYKAAPLDWSRPQRLGGIVRMVHDLIGLRRNLDHHTGGLTLQGVRVFHNDPQNKTLAYHRYGHGGPGDDVIVVVNFSNQRQHDLNIGFPRGGLWRVRFNSGAQAYDPSFIDGDSFDTDAHPGAKEGMGYNGNISVGPYSAVILSQD